MHPCFFNRMGRYEKKLYDSSCSIPKEPICSIKFDSVIQWTKRSNASHTSVGSIPCHCESRVIKQIKTIEIIYTHLYWGVHASLGKTGRMAKDVSRIVIVEEKFPLQLKKNSNIC